MNFKHWQNLNPYDFHKTLINEYFSSNKTSVLKRDPSKDKRDIDVIKENHQFLWDGSEEAKNLSWEKKLAKKYYDKLHKEYCVADLSRYKENKIGLRWRTESELINGKGQFSCGHKRCSETKELKTWEVNFGYIEHGIKKNALIKLRLCPECSIKLNYHHKKKEIKKSKKHRHKLKDNSSKTHSQGAKGFSNKESESDVEIKLDKENEASVSKDETEKDDIWNQSTIGEEAEEKTREDEFDEYLDQLFL